jgi:Mn-containing catalase
MHRRALSVKNLQVRFCGEPFQADGMVSNFAHPVCLSMSGPAWRQARGRSSKSGLFGNAHAQWAGARAVFLRPTLTNFIEVQSMYHHVKKLMYTVKVGTPDPRFGNMLLEQFGGANGELAAAMQYSIQGLNCDDPGRKDLLMDIGTEELSHLEVVGALIRMHLKPMKNNREAAETDPLVAVAGGGGVTLCNSVGSAWTADYLKVTGDLAVDLHSNIAAEARAKIVYERLIAFTDDVESKEALQFLMTREITHMRAFSAALESMEKPPFSIGIIKPTPGLVDQYFNASTGEGQDGARDFVGAWNKSNGLNLVDSEVVGGTGLDVKPYRPQPGTEEVSKIDSAPVGQDTGERPKARKPREVA